MRAARLVESLGEIPGVSPSGPGQTAVPTLRGMARGRTLVLLDGARVTTERRAGASATYLDPFSLGYVEVVRGPGSVAYGSDALGGVIHARTVSPKAGVNGIRYEISAGAGEEYAAIGGEANLALGSGALLAQFHQRSFADYESPGGTVDNSSSRDSGGLLRGLIPLKRARFHVGLQVDRGRDISRPSADEDTARTIYPLEDSDRLTLGIDLPGWKGFTGFEVLAFLGRYRLVTERTTIDPSTSDRQLSRADVEASDASLRFVATRPVEKGYWRAGVDLVTRFGLDATNRVEDHPQGGTPVLVADEETIEEARRVDAGLFVEGERVWGRMSLAAGLRGDDVSTRNRGGFFGDRSTSDGAVSGYAAISWRFGGGMDAAVQVSRGFRDPQLSDRYFRGTTARGRIAGNPDLEPETTRQLDLALRSGKGRIRFGLYGYLYRIRELVERFEIAPGEFAFRNRGEEDVRGIESPSTSPAGRSSTTAPTRPTSRPIGSPSRCSTVRWNGSTGSCDSGPSPATTAPDRPSRSRPASQSWMLSFDCRCRRRSISASICGISPTASTHRAPTGAHRSPRGAAWLSHLRAGSERPDAPASEDPTSAPIVQRSGLVPSPREWTMASPSV
jgi:iron complex outermembrane receptor protein